METLQIPGLGELMTKALPAIRHIETVPVALRELYSFLAIPLLEQHEGIGDDISIQDVPCESVLATVAQATVDYAYSRRFANGDLEQLQDDCHNSRWILATSMCPNQVVWGTVRISWGPAIDVFELFEVNDSPDWSNVSMRQRAATIGRLSFSPAFDALVSTGFATREDLHTLNIARIGLASKLIKMGLAQLDAAAHDQVYFIATEALRAWFAMCGLPSRRVAGAMLAGTKAVSMFQQRFPGYWDAAPCLFEVIGQEPAAF